MEKIFILVRKVVLDENSVEQGIVFGFTNEQMAQKTAADLNALISADMSHNEKLTKIELVDSAVYQFNLYDLQYEVVETNLF